MGGILRGAVVTKEFLDEFGKGPFTLAATTFLRYGSRAIVTMPPVPQGIFSLWVEEIPFVLATIAFGGWKLAGPGLTVANAQLAISDPKKHPEFAGNVKTIEARDFWREVEVSPKNQGYHYNRNAETHMEVGNALGWAMADLLKGKPE